MIQTTLSSDAPFEIDAQLDSSSILVHDLPLCQVRLKNDQRFPWIVLIPRRPELVEVFDLSANDQQLLWTEITMMAEHMHQRFKAHKMNIEILGNKVRQLHIHIIARYETDAAWPNSVLNHGVAESYPPEDVSKILQKITL